MSRGYYYNIYLLIIIFKFNCKSDFAMIKMCKLSLYWTVSFFIL